MKSEIIYSYPLTEGFSIRQVLPINEAQTSVFSFKYPDVLKLDIITDDTITHTLTNELSFKSVYALAFFKYKKAFGFMVGLDEVWLWPTIDGTPQKFKIPDPLFDPSGEYNNNYATRVFYDSDADLFYTCIEYERNFYYPARYWATLKLNDNTPQWSIYKPLSLNRKPRWSELYQLPLAGYPVTEFGREPWARDEWLSINDLQSIRGDVYVHSIGGTTTRLKSGRNYEFSLITKLSTDNKVIKHFPIDEGRGAFNCDGRYFILKKRGKKSLLFYNSNSFTVDFELSLTPKQNLGEGKANHVNADLLGDTLYIYNSFFFNRCFIPLSASSQTA
jgi:hypothetical protein